METRLPCKSWETQLMWLRIYFPEIFGTVPSERYRSWPVPGPRNCVYLHLFIGNSYDCCNHMRPLVHLKQVNTKKNLIYNCNTALKHKNVKTGLGTHFIQYHPIKHQSVIFIKIFTVEIVSEYTLRCTESCV